MGPENQNQSLTLSDQPMNSWAAAVAVAVGIDMSLIELSIGRIPAERFREPNRALQLAWELREVMKMRNVRPNFEAEEDQAGC